MRWRKKSRWQAVSKGPDSATVDSKEKFQAKPRAWDKKSYAPKPWKKADAGFRPWKKEVGKPGAWRKSGAKGGKSGYKKFKRFGK